MAHSTRTFSLTAGPAVERLMCWIYRFICSGGFSFIVLGQGLGNRVVGITARWVSGIFSFYMEPTVFGFQLLEVLSSILNKSLLSLPLFL